MTDRPTIKAVIGLPPDETVSAFDARGDLRSTVGWSEMWHEDHARAFTVAKIAKLDMLGEIQASLADVLANGGTFEQWQANLVPYLQSQGWWGKVADRDLTGTDDVVDVGPRRLRTIYDTNLRVSRAAGRWSRIQELKATRPYLRYTAVLDSRTRPAHRAWHGTVLPVDHPWWNTHYPPCGWFCRCTVRQLSQRDLDAKGWKVTSKPPIGTPTLFYPAGQSAPVSVPAGISPGFGYNAGKASMGAIAARATRSIEATASTDLAAARATLDELVQSDAFSETLSEAGSTFPVMVLDPNLTAAIGANNQVVQLASDVVTGQPGISADDFRGLPAIGASPSQVYRKDTTRIFVAPGDDGHQQVAVLDASSADQLSVLGYHRADPQLLAHLLAYAVELLW